MSQIRTPETPSESAVRDVLSRRGVLRRWSVAELLAGAVVRPLADRSSSTP